jgi:hypothetical protein
MSNAITKYQNFILRQYNGNAVAFGTDTVKVMLVTASYTPNVSTDTFKTTPTAYEVSGTNYTARGATIASVTASQTGGTLTVAGNSIDWAQSASGFTNARYAVIYKDTGTDATSPLIGYIDLVTAQGNVNGDLILNWNSTATNGTIFTAS